MQSYILTGFAFFCVVTGLSIPENTGNEVQFKPEDIQLLSELHVFDDDLNLVSLASKMSLEDEDEESEEETLKDLHNRVFFYLYTRNNYKHPDGISINNQESLKKSDINFDRPTRIITHGWINSRNSRACTLVRDAYLNHDDYNIIVIDWSKISARGYVWASNRVKMVGQYVATMLDFLEKEGLNLSTTTLIGHSLGAHVVGLAAYYAKNTVNSVIGLDPALPGFTSANPGSRISQSDADYVEIIHTNGGLLGYLRPIGDADFFPNGGMRQAGCIIDVIGACSHSRAFEFFAESINSKIGFHAKECDSYFNYKLGICNTKLSTIMGEHKKFLKTRGKFFLDTRSSPPYAIGEIFKP
ncbi:PREDICTED: endothelial lipase-like [Polistes canadensis]|uniref:endothelial lipase-like n=1 Tax=Polistes canadensis TaxID=91411 RepID=UPI000718C2CE|nr:PREDICTED: endothelial lipase-like [Polistes canadensis]